MTILQNDRYLQLLPTRGLTLSQYYGEGLDKTVIDLYRTSSEQKLTGKKPLMRFTISEFLNSIKMDIRMSTSISDLELHLLSDIVAAISETIGSRPLKRPKVHLGTLITNAQKIKDNILQLDTVSNISQKQGEPADYGN